MSQLPLAVMYLLSRFHTERAILSLTTGLGKGITKLEVCHSRIGAFPI